jgi:class 3 adenylate cyclase
LIGREEELSLLEDALLAANRGEGQMVLLAGEAGMGKTRLATDLQKGALKRGTPVLWGSCSEADFALPYLPFVEAIGNYLAEANQELLRERLGPARSELASLFPQLGSEDLSGDHGDPTERKQRLFEAVLSLLRIAAEGHGLLVVLEDLHWADAATRELVDYLSRRLRSARILVLATYRSDEIHRRHPLSRLVHSWRRTTAAQVIELHPLGPAGIANMVSAIFDGVTMPAADRDVINSRSEGNPFVLEELLKVALDRGFVYRTSTGWDTKALTGLSLPQTVRDTILLRVERLDEDQAGILRTAAVLGPSFAYPTLVAVSGQDEAAVQTALHGFVQQQLMEAQLGVRGRYRFRHALTREAIYEDLIEPAREELHGKAAAVLRSMPETAAVDLAHHLVAAGRWAEAVPVCIKAAEDAERRQGYSDAAELYTRILPHLNDRLMRGQILCRLGYAYWAVEDPGRAMPFLRDGVALLEETGQRRDAAKYRIWLGHSLWSRSSPDLARAEFERVRQTLEREGPSEDLAQAYVQLARLHVLNHELQDGRAAAIRAMDVARSVGAVAPMIYGRSFLAMTYPQQGRADEGLALIDESYREAMEHGLYGAAAHALGNGFELRIHSFRGREVIDRMELLRELERIRGADRTNLARYEADLALVLGEPEKARRGFAEALVLAQDAGRLTHVGWYQTGLAEAYSALGQPDEARRQLPKLSLGLEWQDVVELLSATLRINLDAGDTGAAILEAERIGPLYAGRPVFAVELPLLDLGVEAFVSGRDPESAVKLRNLARAAEWAPPDNPYLRRIEGRVALAHNDLETAYANFSPAVTFLREAGYQPEEWRTRRALADAKAGMGDRAGAEADLREVLAGAEEHGHIAEARAAQKQLTDLGAEIKSRAAPPTQEADLHQPSERLVTVMFIDVRGYTALTASEPPHQLIGKISSFYRWADQQVQRHHGRVMHRAGDAVIASFNVSGMRLDHTLHALQAAIEIRDKAAYAGLPLGAGIAVGPAVVGQLSEQSDVTVIGETPNLAARLQAQAAAGEILLSEEAFRRVRDWLAEKQLAVEEERLALKGFAQPVTAYRLRSRELVSNGTSKL